jgi:outer membrane protein OmpA-like peptidoglycan-associated protein
LDVAKGLRSGTLPAPETGARLKPESAPALDEIAKALEDNPDWKLTVEGHTDNIGGDAYNLNLSKRRALAVKEALVTQYNNPDVWHRGGRIVPVGTKS